MKICNNQISKHQQFGQVPLWQLCKKSLSPQTNLRQINQFLDQLKPERIQSIEKGTILAKILNLLIVIEMMTLDRLIFEPTLWGWRQYCFLLFLVFKFMWFKQVRLPSHIQKKHQPQQTLSSLKQVSLRLNYRQRLEKIGEWLVLGLGYFLYCRIVVYLYFPPATQMILFTIMILFANSNQQPTKLSQLIVLSHNFHSYWAGIACLMQIFCLQRVNNKYDLVFEKEEINITDHQAKVQAVEIVFGISLGLIMLQMESFAIIWAFYMAFLWVLVKILEKIDRQCIGLKKQMSEQVRKYKDEGVMVQISQYH